MLQIPLAPGPDTDAGDDRGKLSRVLWRFLSELIAALRNRVPITGTATFAAATTVAVSFTTAEPSAAYHVNIDGGENKTFWVTSKTTTGFTINASASTSATVGWELIRR